MAIPADVSKLSYAELQKMIEDVQQQIAVKRVEEIKVLADAYAKKTTAAGFTIREAIDALKPYLPKKDAGVVKYRDPANTENTWSGKGRVPRWLQAYLDAGQQKEAFLVW
ncbi:H-NS histone family protein [Hydrogenophaga sp. 2FB]|uniref:H-NS histone family protein n=1 Tax=Hydrogenophaga sp. 2FB TaxID=2502187 RepID=UPI001485C1F5|nr:H-NS histone family protein [Hydrogenophaga sp. 2FB]